MQIIDFHTHIGTDKDGKSQSLDELAKSMEEAGVTHSVVFPFNDAFYNVDAASILLLSSTEYHSNLFPFLRFAPKDMSPERLEKLLKNFKGVKLHPRSQRFDPLSENFFPLYEVIEKTGKPLLFHTKKENIPGTDPDRIITLAEYFPNMILIMGHFGGSSPFVVEQMKNHPNVYLETSLMKSKDDLAEVSMQIGSERILFGSDAPYQSQLTNRLKITESLLSQASKERILYHNAAQLMRLE